MIKVEALRNNFNPITSGTFIERLPPQSLVQVADLHVHSRIDSWATPQSILTVAANRGIDVVALTEHDYWTPQSQKKAVGIAKRIRDKYGLELDIIAGSEATVMPVRDPSNTKGKHVLVFNQKKHIDAFMTWENLHNAAQDQEALLYVAHPTLEGISFKSDEVKQMIDEGRPPHGLEVQNGSATLFDRHENLIERFHKSRFIPDAIKEHVPHPGSNKRALEMHDAYKEFVPGLTGGSDAHEAWRVGEVLTVFPQGMTLFDAMQEGKIHIAQKKKISPVKLIPMLHNVYHGRNIHKPSYVQQRAPIRV